MSRLTSEKITNLIRFVQQIPVNDSTDLPDDVYLRQPQRKSDIFYLTTAINYTNGPPHIGHCYEAVTSDAIARYNRIQGRETYFLTGADEHGQKIARAAEAQNITPQQLCDTNVAIFKQLLESYNVSNDQYIRTTDPRHEAQCQQLWLRSVDKGDIFLGSYCGWYNTREEQYVTETEAAKNNYKDPVSKLPLDRHEEPSYFFRMSKYQERLIAHIQSNPSFIRPEKMRNLILKRLEDPLEDLCVSRSTFDWGVPVPNDPQHVMYVWFDALSNYVSALDIVDDSSPLKKFWSNVVHVIGVDIVWFHTVIWPCILMSVDLSLPVTVFCHGFVTDKHGDKMSKSIGNVVDPFDVLALRDEETGELKYDSDTVRFYLMEGGSYGDMIKFDQEAMEERHDSILVHKWGNLVFRCTHLIKKNCGGRVPDVSLDESLVARLALDELKEDFEIAFGDFNLSHAIHLVLAKVSDLNGYLVEREPWKLKKQPEEQARVIRTCVEAVYVLAHFMEPFTPRSSAQVFGDFSTPQKAIRELRSDLCNLVPGTEIHVGPVLFRKITTRFEDLDKKGEVIRDGKGKKGNIKSHQKKKKNKRNGAASKPVSEKIPMERVEFVVGRIVSIEQHAEKSHLYVETIDVGASDGTIQIVSGLANHYQREELEGTLVVVFKNLKNTKFAQVASEGMVMCACNADKSVVEVLRPPEGSVPGERLIWEGGPYTCEADETIDIKNKKKQKSFWDEVSPLLRTNGAGVFCFDGAPFVTSAGQVRCERNVDSQVS